jgi:hypothetical protein
VQSTASKPTRAVHCSINAHVGAGCVQAPAAAAASQAGVAAQAHGYITQAEGLIGQLKGQAGGKFDGFLGTAENLLHQVRTKLNYTVRGTHCV